MPAAGTSPDAFMEELTMAMGGYRSFFRTLVMHHVGWWAAVVAVPALFLDHHKCDTNDQPSDWILYVLVVVVMIAVAVMMEFSVIKKLAFESEDEVQSLTGLSNFSWRLPALCSILWKLDNYTDVVFIFLARDCGSQLWKASMATFIFGVVVAQLLFNGCFAFTDCDKELPSSFGFVLLDFKMVNSAVKSCLNFDPDASHLPIQRPVTLRTTSHLVSLQKAIGDIAQMCIQFMFLSSEGYAHSMVMFSIAISIVNCTVSVIAVVSNWVQDEVAVSGHKVAQGTVLQSVKTFDSRPSEDEEFGKAPQSQISSPTPAPIGRGEERSKNRDRGTRSSGKSNGGAPHASGCEMVDLL